MSELMNDEEIVADLRAHSMTAQRTAWGRTDGGQEWCISALLADQAADLIERLTAERDAALAREAEAFRAGAEAMRSAAIGACEAQIAVFSSPEYATPQPIGSVNERFACRECVIAIRALPTPSKERRLKNGYRKRLY